MSELRPALPLSQLCELDLCLTYLWVIRLTLVCCQVCYSQWSSLQSNSSRINLSRGVLSTEQFEDMTRVSLDFAWS